MKLYNKCFGSIVSVILFSLIAMGFILYSKVKSDGEEKWYSFEYVIKKKLTEMFVFAIMVLILIIFLNETFSIDILVLLHISQYWKFIFSIWVVKNIYSGKKLYDWFNFNDFLQRVKDGKYRDTTPENIMMDIIDRYNSNYILQNEKLGILKSLTPISLIPLVAGYILEGKNITVNWDWYTVVFFAILFLYFYYVWKCYKNMKFWKMRVLEIQKELRQIQYKNEK